MAPLERLVEAQLQTTEAFRAAPFLVSTAAALISAGFAKSTQTAYLPSFHQFIAFALTMGLSWSLILPPDASLVIAFCCSMFHCGKTEGVARRAITGLCSITSALGYSIAGVRNRQLELLLKRYRQLRPSAKRATRHPITHPILQLLLQHVPSINSPHIHASTLSALLLALFFGFFRPGELLCRGLEYTSPPIRAAIMHFPFHSTLHLLASKTDLFHVGGDIHLPLIGGSMCPVGAIVACMAHARFQGPASPLFQDTSGSAVSYELFASVLRLLVRAAGLSHLHLTPHSFRIGAATTAAHCGIPDSAIKALGRWQSVSYQTYTKYSPEALRQIALQLSSSSLSPSSPFGHILPADAARLSFDTVGVAFSASQQRR